MALKLLNNLYIYLNSFDKLTYKTYITQLNYLNQLPIDSF